MYLSTKMNKLVEGIVKITIIILVLLFVVFIFTKRFIYFKPRRKFLDSEENYTSVFNQNIHGWILQNSSNSKIIIYCPGNDNNMSYRQSRIKKIHELGFNILIFDYSGFGKSNGIPNEQNLFNDACTMVSLAYKNYNPNDIVIYGEQLGTCIAAYCVRKYNLNKLILDDPISNIRDLLIKLPRFMNVFFKEFSTATYLNGYIGKSLIFYDANKYDEKLISLCTQTVACKRKEKNLEINFDTIKQFINN